MGITVVLKEIQDSGDAIFFSFWAADGGWGRVNNGLYENGNW